MRTLLLGAGGFIGRRILSELLIQGHDVTAVVRRRNGLDAAFPTTQFLMTDLARATDPADWRQQLSGIDVIVNAAGVLRGPEMQAVHVDMPRALHQAGKDSDVRHVILISAISARDDVATDYSRSKLAGEELLRQSGLNWTILRPSLVYSDGSYGGTSLLRGMAALPWIVPLPGRGDFAFTPIHASDLARAIVEMCGDRGFMGRTLEPVGPETMNLLALLERYRAWLGFGRATFLPVPISLMRLLGKIGDIAGDGPVSTNSLVQLIAGNSGSPAAFADAIGWRPRSLDQSLQSRPADVQDRWHARLFFLAPAIKTTLLFLWLASAWLGYTQGRAATETLVAAAGVPMTWVASLQIGSSLLDLGIAALLLFDRRCRFATLAQLTVVIGYTAVIGSLLPDLWADPFGALLKNVPILALILVHGAIGDRR